MRYVDGKGSPWNGAASSFGAKRWRSVGSQNNLQHLIPKDCITVPHHVKLRPKVCKSVYLPEFVDFAQVCCFLA